jgi:hypothetical protein
MLGIEEAVVEVCWSSSCYLDGSLEIEFLRSRRFLENLAYLQGSLVMLAYDSPLRSRVEFIVA